MCASGLGFSVTTKGYLGMPFLYLGMVCMWAGPVASFIHWVRHAESKRP
jgi:hypothetical protein